MWKTPNTITWPGANQISFTNPDPCSAGHDFVQAHGGYTNDLIFCRRCGKMQKLAPEA